ncbi:MAG: hypothetical protein ACK56I_37350, partial [bacterium]
DDRHWSWLEQLERDFLDRTRECERAFVIGTDGGDRVAADLERLQAVAEDRTLYFAFAGGLSVREQLERACPFLTTVRCELRSQRHLAFRQAFRAGDGHVRKVEERVAKNRLAALHIQRPAGRERPGTGHDSLRAAFGDIPLGGAGMPARKELRADGFWQPHVVPEIGPARLRFTGFAKLRVEPLGEAWVER